MPGTVSRGKIHLALDSDGHKVGKQNDPRNPFPPYSVPSAGLICRLICKLVDSKEILLVDRVLWWIRLVSPTPPLLKVPQGGLPETAASLVLLGQSPASLFSSGQPVTEDLRAGSEHSISPPTC